MRRFHGIATLGPADAGGWREVTGGALAWLVYAPASDPPATTWFGALPEPGPKEPGALLAHIAAKRGANIATGAAAVWSGEFVDVAWLGDVRVVLVRGGRVAATTVDHSLARESGEPSPDLARITRRSLGDGAPERTRWRTLPGDVVVLCSPDLHNFGAEDAWLPAALRLGEAAPGCVLLRTD